MMQVQGTNDSSVVSKASAAALGYFHDAFLQRFVCKVARRAPLVNRCVAPSRRVYEQRIFRLDDLQVKHKVTSRSCVAGGTMCAGELWTTASGGFYTSPKAAPRDR